MRSILTVLFRRKATVLTLAALVLTATIAGTLLMPKQYESHLKILIKNERADPIVSPDPSQRAELRGDVSEVAVNSEIELLTSTPILQKIAAECRLDARENQSGGPEMAIERAVRRLRSDLKITPVRKTSIIQVSYSSDNSARSAAVLRSLSDLYLDAHLKARGVAGTQDFFRTEADQYQQNLVQAESRLSDFRRSGNLTVIGEQKDLTLRSAVDLEKQLNDTSAAIADNASRIQRLRTEIESNQPRMVTQRRVVSNQYSVERLHTMLAELTNKRTDLLTKFRADDRLVTDLDQQIRDTNAALERATKLSGIEEASDVNPLRQTLETELARATVERDGLVARRTSLTAALGRQRARLSNLETATAQDNDLQRTVKEAEDNYLLYKRKQEEARIADSLDRSKIANVAIAEAPLESSLPAKPNVPLNFALGALLACFVSTGAAFALEYARIVFHGPADLESEMNLPVLATAPYSRG